MRFAHMADTHLGYRQYNLDEREDDFYAAFHEVVDNIISENLDFVIHSGDLFDEPRPPVKAMVEVRNALDRLDERGIPVFAIGGNHDILMRRGALPPQSLYKNVKFLTNDNPWQIYNDIFIGGLPYHSQVHASALKERLKTISQEAKKYEKKILVLHQNIDRYFPLDYELRFNDIPKEFDYIAMGHLHKRIVDSFLNSKLSYPGSTEVWRVDELEDMAINGKGFNIVDSKDWTIKQFDLKNIRPFIKREIEAEGLDIKELRSSLDLKRRPILQLIVLSDNENYPWLYQKLVREFKDALYLDIKRRWTPEEGKTFPEEKIGIKELIKTAMKEYPSEEVDFAYALFKSLSLSKMEEDKEISEEFFKMWAASERRKKVIQVEGREELDQLENHNLEEIK